MLLSPMELVALTYVSRISKTIDPSDLAELHLAAQERNRKVNISGMLVFGGEYFIQCIEGGQEEVNHLYSKINKDPRHQELQIVSFQKISERQFENWSMKLIMMTEKNKAFLLKFTSDGIFNPYDMSADNIDSFMLAMR